MEAYFELHWEGDNTWTLKKGRGSGLKGSWDKEGRVEEQKDLSEGRGREGTIRAEKQGVH